MKRFLAAATLSTAVLASLPVPLVAQVERRQPPPQPAGAPQQPAGGYVSTVQNVQELREQFRAVMKRYPASVGRVLRLDPSLLSDPNYLRNYPAIQQFVAQYPEITRSPDFFLTDYGSSYYGESRSESTPEQAALNLMNNWIEMFMIFLVVVSISAAVLWLLKSLIEHRRWLRMTRTQTEVHTKLLDRFSSSEELLAYMRTPAGSRFLESAPISVDAGSPRSSVSAPINRILWSVQAGIVLLLAGLAVFMGRSWTPYEEVRTMLAMIGTLGSFIGIGFIVSAGAAWAMSQRFGLLEGTRPAASPSVSSGRVDSPGA